MTSYVAAEPGTRPSTDGLDGFDDMNHYGGLLGDDAGEINGGFGTPRPKPNLATLIDTRPCLEKFPQRAGWEVTLSVETTREEIVDVSTEAKSPFAACLVEAAWSVRLDATVFDLLREQFTVALR